MKTPLFRFLRCATLALAALPAFAATYYVDSAATSDGAGTQTSPWKTLARVNNGPANNGGNYAAGDSILFKRGGVWNGQLFPRGSGVSGNVIRVDAYGTGDRPAINGNGVTANGGGAVVLLNSQYFEITNLEVTNYATSNADRHGIYVQAIDTGVRTNLRVTDCYVHNVRGDITDRDTAKQSAGIYLAVTGSVNGATRFHDVRIERNSIVGIDGIGVGTVSSWRATKYGLAGTQDWNGHTGVVIADNYIEDCAKDGILIRETLNALVEGNVVCNPASKFNGGGMWPYNCGGAKFQHNEVFGTKLLGTDGAGFDADYRCEDTVFQYNYSHNNEGGAFNIMRRYNKRPIIRYNISRDDGCFLSYAFNENEIEDVKVYNNVFYINSTITGIKVLRPVSAGSVPVNTAFENNVFYGDGTATWPTIVAADAVTFSHNSYFGGIPARTDDANRVTIDPLLVAPTTGGQGLGSVAGFRLSNDSPLRDAGKSIVGNGGKDYFGNTLYNGVPDIGAHEYAVADNTRSWEAEDLPAVDSARTAVRRNTALSNDRFSLVTNCVTGSYAEYSIYLRTGGNGLAISAGTSDGPSRGKWQLSIDGVNQGAAQDSYAAAWSAVNNSLGTKNLSSGEHTFRFTVTGQNAAATDDSLGIDYINIGATRFEAEHLPVLDSCKVTLKDNTGMSGGFYSFIDRCLIGDFVEYTVDVPTAGTYSLVVKVSEGPSRGIWQCAVDGANVGGTFDAYDPVWKVTTVNLGSRSYTAGVHKIRFTVTGKNNASSTYNMGFDTLALQ